jgi:hypothetical protein
MNAARHANRLGHALGCFARDLARLPVSDRIRAVADDPALTHFDDADLPSTTTLARTPMAV